MPKNKDYQNIYFVGIKGVAMAGLAIMSKEQGYVVTGSDVNEVFITDQLLDKHSIKYFNGFDAQNIKGSKPDLIVIGAAYGTNNPEVKAAKSLRLPVMTQSELLGKIMAEYVGVGVSGVHGKTTTTSMLTLILQDAGFSPSYAIGTSDIPGLDSNAHVGEGQYFVVEADEYK
ncbi:MAG: Mur ligase domain-containing protein, partial [Patescibacteria group bacterium]